MWTSLTPVRGSDCADKRGLTRATALRAVNPLGSPREMAKEIFNNVQFPFNAERRLRRSARSSVCDHVTGGCCVRAVCHRAKGELVNKDKSSSCVWT